MVWKRSEIEIDCECGWFRRNADDPEVPIEFNADVNEYQLVSALPGRGSRQPLYFCPFCGCRAPRSTRADKFHTLTHTELQRLSRIVRPLKTVEELISKLGEPDRRAPGVPTVHAPSDGSPERAEVGESLTYTRLSSAADVHVQVVPGAPLRFGFTGKPKQ
jgi:hypothetical protein